MSCGDNQAAEFDFICVAAVAGAQHTKYRGLVHMNSHHPQLFSKCLQMTNEIYCEILNLFLPAQKVQPSPYKYYFPIFMKHSHNDKHGKYFSF
jgi:hypothetical protein